MKEIEDSKKENSKIWFSWESIKDGHLSEEVKSYIKSNFKKIHGQGIDNVGVEVFYGEWKRIVSKEQKDKINLT